MPFCKFYNLIYLLLIILFTAISCSSGGDNNHPDINGIWEMVHFTEWNSEESKCEMDLQDGMSLYWKIENVNKLTKYGKVSEALGGTCIVRTYSIVIEDNIITLKEGGESGADKPYRYELSENTLELYDDEESVEGCQEKLEFKRIEDETEFESIAENCMAI